MNQWWSLLNKKVEKINSLRLFHILVNCVTLLISSFIFVKFFHFMGPRFSYPKFIFSCCFTAVFDTPYSFFFYCSTFLIIFFYFGNSFFETGKLLVCDYFLRWKPFESICLLLLSKLWCVMLEFREFLVWFENDVLAIFLLFC